MELKGKRALVTGGTTGIGLAVVRALLRQQVEVALCSRTASQIEAVVNSLGRGGRPVVGRACDVGDPRQVEALIEFCRRELGGLEILINNAGVGIFAPVEQLTVAQWQTTIRTNLDGVFYCCHYALPLLLKSNGFIINISSLAGKNAFPGGAAYNASKFALTGFSEALMQEVRQQGVQVAYLMPGSVDTGFSRKSRKSQRDNSWKISVDDVAQVVIETLSRSSTCLTSRVELRPPRPPGS